nr:PREDICTED: membrane-anchored junction protein isoform X2 [Rhinolophus sinicus]
MSLKPFTYPFPETRFFHAGSSVYKFKIRYGNSIRGEDIENKEVILQELEDSIRVILGNSDNLQPFTTKHFIIFPYKSKWERVSHLKFKQGEIVLAPYPFVFTLYVEMKWFHEKLSPGKPTNNSPLGLVLAERKAAGAIMRKRKYVDVPNCPSRQGLDRANMVTSSQSPSKKKPPVGTARVPDGYPDFGRIKNGGEQTNGPEKKQTATRITLNRERKTQQECQETPAFDITDVQEQDSKWEDSPAGQIMPPLQQTNPPPAKGPTELGTRGFFGFLSSLFPFRYLFRRSSQ